MDTTSLENVRRIILEERNVERALSAMKPLLSAWSTSMLHGDFDQIESDYQLMLDFMRRGYSDPNRSSIYERLLSRLDRLTWVLQLQMMIKKYPFLVIANEQSRNGMFDVEKLQQELETYVEQAALQSLHLDLLPANDHLEEEHHRVLRNAFEAIIVSSPWLNAQAETLYRLFSSASIDPSDACLLISALMLSASTIADVSKVLLLIRVYRNSADERIRQRALVGWAICMLSGIYSFQTYPELATAIGEVISDEECAQQIVRLQLQLLYCYFTDSDTQVIRQEIMPDIMSENQYFQRHNGLFGNDEQNMDDILEPQAEEEHIERMERHLERIADMHRAGTDVYFGGFSQTKRHPFFHTLYNWFMPFSMNHPSLAALHEEKVGSSVIKAFFTSTPLCESDKYSFALMLPDVLKKVPQNMTDALTDGINAFGVHDENLTKADSIRRLYLQDIYRFFRLSDFRHPFFNPFHAIPSQLIQLVFSAKVEIVDETKILPIATMLYRRRAYEQCLQFLDGFPNVFAPSVELFRGHVLRRLGLYDDAAEHYLRCVQNDFDNQKAKRGLLHCYMPMGRYEDAMPIVKSLVQTTPDDIELQLIYGACLVELGNVEEALQLFYKLHYHSPEHIGVSRAIAWASLRAGNADKAQSILKDIVNTSAFIPQDVLYLGYSLWAKGDIESAIKHFLQYVVAIEETYSRDSKDVNNGEGIAGKLKETFISDAQLLAPYDIKDVDQKLMAALVAHSL